MLYFSISNIEQGMSNIEVAKCLKRDFFSYFCILNKVVEVPKPRQLLSILEKKIYNLGILHRRCLIWITPDVIGGNKYTVLQPRSGLNVAI
ncbi:MAG: hypothetical protein RLZZ292_2544 [Bacteroidota bacterium]|jgi:hypothetical protein